ncbi:DALR anticodon-binding domain-containing protein 3 isoform X3 [Hypanus sabinus]|uniref:DALR anticodon-binding domain-containing protein 3 isoform X3 n=1 Tax=Hypanus sabinus TaxID=79690 RepID=UPI0028C42791|nr:DALR anticodon-binding domain-containing protein 3 isoform X3 [Hypanus sabinus]
MEARGWIHERDPLYIVFGTEIFSKSLQDVHRSRFSTPALHSASVHVAMVIHGPESATVTRKRSAPVAIMAQACGGGGGLRRADADPEFTLAGCAAALEAALGGGEAGCIWFKESKGRNLRSRDWIAPRGALRKLYPQGQVPEDVIERLLSEYGHRLYIHSCAQTGAGAVIHLDHPALFKQILNNLPLYTRPLKNVLPKKKCVILNCAPLQASKGPELLTVNHLRAILLADHLAEVLRQQGYVVHTVPNLRQNAAACNFLKSLGVSWTSSQQTALDNGRVSDFKKILSESAYTRRGQLEAVPDQTRNTLPKVKEETLRQIAELQHAVSQSQEDLDQCMVIHVVGCEEEFQQQKVDVLWRILNPEINQVTQRHLVCGPVRKSGEHSHISALQYFEFRRSQMQEASVMKYGDKVQGGSWAEIINSMTSAVIRFELLAVTHRSPLNLDLTQGVSISTKGTRSGAFVMYNCARLATLFNHFSSSVEKGLYPHFPETSQLNYFALQEEGEWLLLYNYIIPFREALVQITHSLGSAKGIHLSINTETVCKFLVNLSMDFSSYYNRVHILGEPREHLFNQMFTRLQLMKGLREVFHTALGTLHIPPPSQL